MAKDIHYFGQAIWRRKKYGSVRYSSSLVLSRLFVIWGLFYCWAVRNYLATLLFFGLNKASFFGPNKIITPKHKEKAGHGIFSASPFYWGRGDIFGLFLFFWAQI